MIDILSDAVLERASGIPDHPDGRVHYRVKVAGMPEGTLYVEGCIVHKKEGNDVPAT